MAQVGTLTVDLIANTASFNANISKAAAQMNARAADMNRSLASIQKGVERVSRIESARAFLEIGQQLAELAKGSLEFAGSLGTTAQQLGVTTKQLQVYYYIGSQVGIQQEEMDRGLAKLTVSLGQAALGASAPTKAFNALGISLRDSSGHVKTAGDVLPEIANKLAKISDPAQRAAVEVALFGREGQELDTILSRGQGGIDEYAKRAEQLGLVLSDKLINQADEAASRMAELSTQMKVSFAGVVAQNVSSILALANALATLTGNVVNFVAQYPRFSAALTGVVVGSRVGGLPGAIIGGGVGFAAGSYLSGQAADQNMDLRFRQKQLNTALANYRNEKKVAEQDAQSGGPILRVRRGTGLDAARQEVQKQTDLAHQALAAARKPKPPPVVDLPEFLAPTGGSGGGGRKGPKGPSADQLAEQAARREREFQDQLANLNADYIDAKRDNLTSAEDIATNARQSLMAERARLIIDTEAKVKAGDLTRAQADLVEQKAAQVAAEKLLTINTEEVARKSSDAFNLQLAANDNQRDILQAQNELATTAADRRKSALALLDLDKQEEKLRLQHIIDLSRIGQATAAEAKAAQDRLGKLDQIYGARAESVNRQTEGPLATYLRDIPKGANEIGERIEQLEVDELESVRQGIDNAISKVIGTKDPLIIGLIDLFIRENLLRPIAEALQKAHAGSSGGGGGWLSTLLHIGASVATGGTGGVTVDTSTFAGTDFSAFSTPMFANGTTGAPGGLSLVGEDGPEFVRLPTGAQVIPNHRLPSRMSPANDTAPVQVTMHNDFRGADAAAVAAISQRLDRMQAEFPASVVKTVQDAESRFILRRAR